MSEKIVQLNEEVIKGQIKELVRVVSRIFRKMVCRLWHERSQPAMEASSRAASMCFMFMYFLLPYWVPATWRNRAQTSMRAEFPSGKLPTTRVRQRRGRAACAEGFAGKGAPSFGLKRARRRAFLPVQPHFNQTGGPKRPPVWLCMPFVFVCCAQSKFFVMHALSFAFWHAGRYNKIREKLLVLQMIGFGRHGGR